MAPQFGLPLLAFDQATTRKVVASVVKVGAVVNVGATVTATIICPRLPDGLVRRWRAKFRQLVSHARPAKDSSLPSARSLNCDVATAKWQREAVVTNCP